MFLILTTQIRHESIALRAIEAEWENMDRPGDIILSPGRPPLRISRKIGLQGHQHIVDII